MTASDWFVVAGFALFALWFWFALDRRPRPARTGVLVERWQDGSMSRAGFAWSMTRVFDVHGVRTEREARRTIGVPREGERHENFDQLVALRPRLVWRRDPPTFEPVCRITVRYSPGPR